MDEFTTRGVGKYCATLFALFLALIWGMPLMAVPQPAVSDVVAVASDRVSINLNADWQFNATDLFNTAYSKRVDIPHSWNAEELWDAELQRLKSLQYSRGKGTYQKQLDIDEGLKGKRLFLRFEGANLVADVSLNGHSLGQHRGGYSAFVFEITDVVKFGEPNALEVVVDNSLFDDIAPLQGDFNIYGGLIRPVSLIATHPVNISVTDYGGPGVYLTQRSVTAERASVGVLTKLDNGSERVQIVDIVVRVSDASGELISEYIQQATLAAGEVKGVSQTLDIKSPHLWQGAEDPYLYQVDVELLADGVVVDRVRQSLGLRKIRVDAERGLFLNDRPVKLKGVALHEDWAGAGAALSTQQRDRDFQLIREMGANALRLAHYPHAEYSLNLADRAGMLVWSEIPFVGFPIGPIGGYTDSIAFRDNLLQQLTEMIRQQYNHPSVAFWGLYNELPDVEGAHDATAFLRDVQARAKREDPTRLTVSAAFAADTHSEINNITDLQFWNRYFGWYYGDVDGLGAWADTTHSAMPQRPVGVSEYGSGGSVYQHSDHLDKPYAVGDTFHPENWQAHQHEAAWQSIVQRDFLAGSFVWAMFDFSSHNRTEGDTFGQNDKGLVTYDRRIKKDAYYFYQANWSAAPMVHLADKRHTSRVAKRVDIKVYSNLDSLELWVNGQSYGEQSPDEIRRFIWPDIELVSGNNAVRVIGVSGGRVYEDRVVWSRSATGPVLEVVSMVLAERAMIAFLMVILMIFLYLRAYRFAATPGGTAIAKVGFYFLVVALLIYLAAIFYLWQAGLLLSFN